MSPALRGGSFLAALALLAAPSGARADGAFPNSQNIMTPAALPHEILLGTNFGLVMSFDDGRSWTYSCEQPLSSFATLYQVGPPPANRIYAVSPMGAISSSDVGCSWSAATDVPAGAALDVYADQSDGNHVLAVVSASTDAGVLYQVRSSSNGGQSFGTVIYTAAAGDHVTGVEVSRSAPQTIYLTLTSGTTTFIPKVAQTTDGGAHWAVHDLSASLPAKTYSLSLIAVDPANAQTLFLRTGSSAGETLAVSTDGGMTATSPIALAGGSLTAFTRMDNGHLIAAGLMGTTNVAYRSMDGGKTFLQLPSAIPVRGLSARGGTLFAATDTLSVPEAIDTSSDEGVTWQPLMAYMDIQAIESCVMALCQDDCDYRAGMQQWSDAICSATAPVSSAGGSSGGPGTGGTRADAGAVGTGGQAGHGSGGGAGDKGGSGCSCRTGGDGTPWSWVTLLGLVLAGRRRPRRPS